MIYYIYNILLMSCSALLARAMRICQTPGLAMAHALTFAAIYLIGPEPEKLPPSAIWPRLLGLSRKQCLETCGEQGETPDSAGLGTQNFPEDG